MKSRKNPSNFGIRVWSRPLRVNNYWHSHWRSHWYYAGIVFMALAIYILGFGLNAYAAPTDANSNSQTLETSVKAAYLYKFFNYVDWPPNVFAKPDSPYVVAIFNADPIAAELSRITAGRMLKDRPLVIKRIKPGDSLAGIHLLFIGDNDPARAAQMLKAAQQRAILTVTENEDALPSGSSINFRTVDGRVRFEVALDTAEKNELKLSSRLLSVALSVRTVE